MTTHKSIFYQAQEQVCEALNEDEVLSGKVTFISENSKDIDYELKNALGRQGIVGVVMTPDATYQGVTSDGEQVWDLKNFTVQVVENPIVNRGQPKYANITAHDAATRATEVLAAPSFGLFGQYCPVTIEQGEDDGLIVAQAKFDVQIRAEREPIPGKYRVYWYVESGSADSLPGVYKAGAQITFTSDADDKVLEYVSVNGVEIPDTSVYGGTTYTYTVPEEDVFVKVVFRVPVVVPVANFDFTGVNVSCDLEPGQYAPGVVAHFAALPEQSMSDGLQQSMLSSFAVNGQEDLDVARSFARPQLSATAWEYELKEGDNDVTATASILPYWKDRTCWWLAYNDGDGVLKWRGGLHRESFWQSAYNSDMYITGPNGVVPGIPEARPIKTLEWNGMDWRDIEEVFVPCYQYNTQTGDTYSPGQFFHPYAFANMPSLRKCTVDVLRESDSDWSRCGRTGGGYRWHTDCVYFAATNYSSIANIAGTFWNCRKFEEFDYGYSRGGFIRFGDPGGGAGANQSGIRLANMFYGTKLKDLRLRIYVAAEPAATGAVGPQQPVMANWLAGVRNEEPTTFQIEYVKQSDGYGADSQPVNNLNQGTFTGTYGTIPYYRPRVEELVWPTLSESQQATISAFTTVANRTICTSNSVRQFYEDLKRIVVPNWAPNTVIGGNSFINPSLELKEIVLSAGNSVLATTATFWADRTFDPTSSISSATFPSTPTTVSVYLPDADYAAYLQDAQWSQLSAKGYELRRMSEWPAAPLGAL